MKFIDLHCDTIMRIMSNRGDFNKAGDMHVTLPDMIDAGVVLQVFACCIINNRNAEQRFSTCLDMVKGIRSVIESNKDHLFLVRNAEDVESANGSDGKIGILIGIEGAAPLDGDAEKIIPFFEQGVRLLTIVWNDNPFCGSVFGDQSGLTEKGRELIHLCETLGIIIDVSHASDQGFYDILSSVTKPFVASHSNSREICPNSRNLTDDMICKIAENGGVIGINFGSEFISPETYEQSSSTRKKFMAAIKSKQISSSEAMKEGSKIMESIPRPSMDWVRRHIQHIIDKGGEDCICFGSDFDGILSMPDGIEGVSSFPKIAELLHAEGFTPGMIDKICWKNSSRILSHLPSS